MQGLGRMRPKPVHLVLMTLIVTLYRLHACMRP